MDLNDAIRLEVSWKVRFQHAIRSGDPLYVEIIARDDCCEFGRWLYQQAIALHGALPHFQPCVDTHALFHAQAARVAQAINDRRIEDAERLLAPGEAYSQAAEAVAEAIGRLKRSISLSGRPAALVPALVPALLPAGALGAAR